MLNGEKKHRMIWAGFDQCDHIKALILDGASRVIGFDQAECYISA